MRTPTVLRPDPARVLVVAANAARAEALAALVPSGCATKIVVADEAGEVLAAPTGYGAIVVDAVALESGWVGELRVAVENGACLLSIAAPPSAVGVRPEPGGEAEGEATTATSGWAELTRARAVSAHPLGEWFGKVAFGAGEVVDRVPEEFGFVDSFVGLEASGDASVVLAVSVAFAERPLIVERRLGQGRVVTSGVGQTLAALGHPEIATVLRRSLLPPGALGRAGGDIGFGILGYGPYGGMGLYHGLAAQATQGLVLAAACDSDAGRRKAAEREFPGLRAYESIHDLVADEDVELVVVATPPSTHFALALELARAGKHVALEKPMCTTLTEADQLMAAADAAGVALTVHQSRRWDADFVAIKRLVESGALGEVFNTETFVGGFEHPCRAWHSEVSVSGGAVYDWGSHHIDWILQLMNGFPTTLTAHGHKRVWHDVTNLDQVRVRLAWADGREAEFMQSDIAAFRRPKFFVQGTTATLTGSYHPVRFERVEPGLGYVSDRAHHAEAPAELRVASYEPGAGLSETTVPLPQLARFGFHRNLADHLHFGEPLAVEPGSVRKVVALLEAAQRSTDEGNIQITLPEL